MLRCIFFNEDIAEKKHFIRHVLMLIWYYLPNQKTIRCLICLEVEENFYYFKLGNS